ncbi:hypothetical protein [Mycobacterium sp. 1245852.3]|uniref:hypothetical protein n=1 Tax=Mycobacterium sp. 1245852.3 TaxID=1856860 RepID=UPI0008019D48|nr:hypothetical protein [Mycobacterium sp. 1245852.3]OBJ85799.1 hypothetical protein A9W96_25715 [Mycobacterium sp. 1245852.3]
MSKTGEINYRRGERNFERHISVRSVDRDPPDLRKLSRAVIAIALRDAEAHAEALAALKGSVDSTIETPSAAEQSDNPEQPNA